MPLVLRQSVDKCHDGGFFSGSVRLASLRCLYLVNQALAFGPPLVLAGLGLFLGEEGGLRAPILLDGPSEPSGGVFDRLLGLELAGQGGGGPFHQLWLVRLDDGAGGFLGHAVGRQAGDEAGKAGIVAQRVGDIGTGVLGDAETQGLHLAALLDLLVFKNDIGLGVDLPPRHVHHADA